MEGSVSGNGVSLDALTGCAGPGVQRRGLQTRHIGSEGLPRASDFTDTPRRFSAPYSGTMSQ
jgi:hypothetical protein